VKSGRERIAVKGNPLAGTESDIQSEVTAVDRGKSWFDEQVEERARFVERTIAREGVRDLRVLAAMRRVPRHRFVPEAVRAHSYEDHPLPIGFGQTISQAFIVAYMTEHAKVTTESRCLEIGTGSGYQAAILCELGREVFSIEYFPELADFARDNLVALGYHVIQRVGDGALGWPEIAPFDVIMITAAPLVVPSVLLDQLAEGGHLIVPVGGQRDAQTLERWTRRRTESGKNAFDRERLTLVQFVPFLGENAGK
jgi:protein-L-isoaspartate(D-aspartate) O-methyltransferase